MKLRYLQHTIINDALKDGEIAFISGPRQVGKTTLAQNILSTYQSEKSYFNWVDDEFKKMWTFGLLFSAILAIGFKIYS